MRRLLLAPMLLLLCGFQVLAIRWPDNPQTITLRVIEEGLPAGALDTITQAAAIWSSPQLHFVILGQQDPRADQGTIAVSETIGNRGIMGTDFTAKRGALHTCAITVLGGVDIALWHMGAEAPAPQQYDFFTLIAHELGHCLGLNHSEDTSALMTPVHPAGTYQRVLSQDDVLGRDALYPPQARRYGGCGKLFS